jgi:hypothetical protein
LEGIRFLSQTRKRLPIPWFTGLSPNQPANAADFLGRRGPKGIAAASLRWHNTDAAVCRLQVTLVCGGSELCRWRRWKARGAG